MKKTAWNNTLLLQAVFFSIFQGRVCRADKVFYNL